MTTSKLIYSGAAGDNTLTLAYIRSTSFKLSNVLRCKNHCLETSMLEKSFESSSILSFLSNILYR